MRESLNEIVAAELAEPVDPRVEEMARAIADRYGAAARAMLFYGSCLRSNALEGLMLDFYLVVSSYRDAYGRSWLAPANRLIPPNVFPFEHEGLAAKYAVLSEADFARECSPAARSVSVWARFAQPSRLVWAADEAARERAVHAIAQAAPTLFTLTLPVLDAAAASDPLEVWRQGFALTYGAELRAERQTRSSSIVDSDPARYQRIAEAVLPRLGAANVAPEAMRGHWRQMQRKGKALSVIRLVKASGTFAGGIDYLAWKINRHAGTDIVVQPWQRRWPLLGAFTLLPRLLKQKAIR